MENFGLFDKWSKQHFMVGAVVGGFGLINVWQYIILHSLFEVWENTIGIAEGIGEADLWFLENICY